MDSLPVILDLSQARNVDSRIRFEKTPGGRPPPATGLPQVFADRRHRLSESVVERFRRLTNQQVVVIPPEFVVEGRGDALPAELVHPLCREFAGSDYCHRCWQAHVGELAASPQAHWHVCDNGRLCAAVPVVSPGGLFAVCKLTCPSSLDCEEFLQHVELLQVLVENFVLECPVLPDTASTANPSRQNAPPPPPHLPVFIPLKQPTHMQVRHAVEYIEEHLTDSDLTVAGIAEHLETNPAYLAHLFSEETGAHMSHYIACRRVERAKHLLSETDWQIKRISCECGMVHPDWFSQVFRAHTGMTPTEYRRLARGA